MVAERYSSYTRSNDWNDVRPIYLSDEESAVLNISYSDRFREVFAYFRAIVEKDEVSERALLLTEDAANLNPANYSVWYYRRKILHELKKDLYDELRMCSAMITETPKNYQLWHHRRVIVETLMDPSGELDYLNSVLHEDAKNYHAWQYRMWLVQEFKLTLDELNYSGQIISNDVRNNSAWNYRYHILNCTSGFTGAVVDNEIALCFDWIKLVPNNESVWNYLNGILEYANAVNKEVVLQFCNELLEKSNCSEPSPFALLYLYDYWSEKYTIVKDDTAKANALEACNRLIKTDPIRRNYYEFLAKSVETCG